MRRDDRPRGALSPAPPPDRIGIHLHAFQLPSSVNYPLVTGVLVDGACSTYCRIPYSPCSSAAVPRGCGSKPCFRCLGSKPLGRDGCPPQYGCKLHRELLRGQPRAEHEPCS